MYSTYIRQFDNNVALLDEQCRKNPAFAAVVKEFEVQVIILITALLYNTIIFTTDSSSSSKLIIFYSFARFSLQLRFLNWTCCHFLPANYLIQHHPCYIMLRFFKPSAEQQTFNYISGVKFPQLQSTIVFISSSHQKMLL